MNHGQEPAPTTTTASPAAATAAIRVIIMEDKIQPSSCKVPDRCYWITRLGM